MELEKLDIKQMSLNQEVINSKDFKTSFIADWPMAKITLQSLKSATKNPVVKWVISIVIGAGDALFEQLSV